MIRAVELIQVLRELASNPKNTPGRMDSSQTDYCSNTMFGLVAALAQPVVLAGPLRREEHTDRDRDRREPDRNTILRG
jgi:hypothetical protein